MIRIGLRRRMPRLSYCIRWMLVQVARAERTFARMTPEEQDRVLGLVPW